MAIVVSGAPPWRRIVDTLETDLGFLASFIKPTVLGEIVVVILGAETGALAIEGIIDVLLKHGLKVIAEEIGKIATNLTQQGFRQLKQWAQQTETKLERKTQPGGTKMALGTLQSPPTCVTGRSTHKGICCAAVTQLGLAQAAAGFQYTSCTGRTVCLACGTKASQSKAHPGQTVFSVKRVSCGPSGCPALATLQGQIVSPA